VKQDVILSNKQKLYSNQGENKMKTSINKYDFRDAFQKAGRENNFSYDGLRVLFDYIEEVEESCGEEIELDVIGLCCDFAESHWSDIANDYSNLFELDTSVDESEQEAQVLDFLADQGVLVGNTVEFIIYRQF
jgi:hypothetical protein